MEEVFHLQLCNVRSMVEVEVFQKLHYIMLCCNELTVVIMMLRKDFRL